MPRIYRIENPNTHQGLWYNRNGVFNPFITKIPDALCRDLPMDFDEQFKLDGLDWLSACDNLDDMSSWFARSDVINLAEAGYNLYGFDVTQFRTLNGHAVFAREHIVGSALLDNSVLLSRMG